MADAPSLAIAKRIAALMKADANFSTVAGYVIGAPFIVPNTRYPLCEIIVEDERPDPQDTGFTWRRISGEIRFSIREQSALTFDGNDLAVESTYITIYDYIQAAIDLFAKLSNRTLNALTFANGGLVSDFTLDDLVTYGINDRDNTFENMGVVPWTALTKEPRDFT